MSVSAELFPVALHSGIWSAVFFMCSPLFLSLTHLANNDVVTWFVVTRLVHLRFEKHRKHAHTRVSAPQETRCVPSVAVVTVLHVRSHVVGNSEHSSKCFFLCVCQ